MKSFERGVEPFVVAGESAEARGPSEASLHNPSSGKSTKPRLAIWVLEHFEADAVAGGGLCSSLAGVALIHMGHLQRAAGDGLHFFGQRFGLGAIPLISGGNAQCKQVPQGVDDDVNLRSPAPFRAVVVCSRAALGRGLQRAAIDSRLGRLTFAPGKFAQQNPRVFHQPLEESGSHPALHLLKDRRPQRMIVRHKPPLVARTRDVADTVEHRSQIMFPVRAVFAA